MNESQQTFLSQTKFEKQKSKFLTFVRGKNFGKFFPGAAFFSKQSNFSAGPIGEGSETNTELNSSELQEKAKPIKEAFSVGGSFGTLSIGGARHRTRSFSGSRAFNARNMLSLLQNERKTSTTGLAAASDQDGQEQQVASSRRSRPAV